MKRTLALTLLLLATIHAAAHEEGLVVDSVVPGSAAEAAGLRAGDRVLRLDGKTIATVADLHAAIAAHRPGERVLFAVERDGEPVELKLTFGARPDGGASIGATLKVMVGAGDDGMTEIPLADREKAAAECREWIETTYRVESMAKELGVELEGAYPAALACVASGALRMTPENAVRYCDNVFKVHCAGLDLLSAIAESQVRRCELLLDESLGLKPQQHKGWKTCAQHKVFDRYVLAGERSDQTACTAALLDQCGTNIDAAILGGAPSSEQQGFAACCRAERIPSEPCAMIDAGFSQGPCLDRPVCVNRLSGEWLHCSTLQE